MSLNTMMILLITSLSISMSVAISLTKMEGSTVKEGETLSVKCKVDVWYEWCTFTHNDNICDFEYKYDLNDVEAINCTDYDGRVTFMGDYQKSECGIDIVNATAEDAGNWTCEFEEYYSGRTRNYGSKTKGQMVVEVMLKPTTPTPTTTPMTTTTTTTPSTTPPTTTTTTTTTPSTTSSLKEIEHHHPKMMINMTKPKEKDMGENKTDSMAAPHVHDKDVDAASATTPIVVAMCILILVGGLALVYGLHYKRRLHPMFYSVLGGNRWKPMSNNDTIMNSTILNGIKNDNVDTELEAMEAAPSKTHDATNATCIVEDEDAHEEKKDAEKEVGEKGRDGKGSGKSLEDLKLGVLHSDL